MSKPLITIILMALSFSVFSQNGQVTTTTGTAENLYYKDGNLGLGIANPGSKLFVDGNIGFHQPNNSTNGIIWKNNSYAKISASIMPVDMGSFATQGIGFFTGNFTDNTTNAVERMRISGNGNIGIGTTTPMTKLDAYGIVRTSNVIPQFDLFNTTNGDLWGYIKSVAGTGSGSSLVFGTKRNGDNVTNKMIILDNGNVGIGTTTTGTHKLAVDGTIGAREIKVEATGWSDFVFENDYELKDLEEVESFIKENKHLPDVASEKEVLENGIQLGEMDAKLLQKIEELTLYVIEQNKMLRAQNEKTENLLKRVGGLEVENRQLRKEITKIQ